MEVPVASSSKAEQYVYSHLRVEKHFSRVVQLVDSGASQSLSSQIRANCQGSAPEKCDTLS